MKLKTKIWLLTATIISVIIMVDLVSGYRNIETSIRENLEGHARDIRSVLMATRRVYQKQFLASGLPLNDRTIGFLPAHALARISRDFPNWSRSGLSFNNVSDRPRNPDNQADRNELEAMAWFRSHPSVEERLTEIHNDAGERFYHYTSPIWMESYCLRCHGEREKAPPSIKKNYDAAFGYHEGELRGVLSIKLPTANLREQAYRSWGGRFGFRLAGYAALFVLLGSFWNRMVSGRLTRLEQAAGRIAAGNYSERGEVEGEDEVASLSGAFNKMAEAIEVRDTALKDNREHYRMALESMRDALILIEGAEGEVKQWNRAAETIFGYTQAEVLGRPLDELIVPSEFREGMRLGLRRFSETGEGPLIGHTIEVLAVHKNGHEFPVELSLSAVSFEGQWHAVGVVRDITERKQADQELRKTQTRIEHMAYYDMLTDLPNRMLLGDRLKQMIAQATRRQNLLAICYLDLDGFKPINDTWGHEAGDQLLIEVARRLKGAIRSEDTVARLGGDEFVVLLGEAGDAREIELAVRRVQTAVSAPFLHGDMEIALTASIGVTVYPHDGQDADTLIRHADQAMYGAKQSGKDRFLFFDPESERLLRERRETILSVKQGLMAEEFCLYYQPKVDMRRGNVVGMEALIRWQHPKKGLLLPAAFLPLVEDSDFSPVLGRWVLRQAIQQMALWAEKGLELPVSINISARHLEQEDFVADLAQVLGEYPSVKPSWIELEILETTAMNDIEKVSGIMAACSNLGVSFALDDFGTGYASLTYFRRLPAHRLKIDQSFVRGMLDDADDLALVEGIIGLAQTLTFQRQVIAEGVETIEHGVPLMHFGCDLAQGYAISPPMSAWDVPSWVRDWRVPDAWKTMAAVQWSREDFPLLLAEIHHRRWVDRFVAIVTGNATVEAAPTLGTHECRFGQWLYGTGRNRFGSQPVYSRLEDVHDRVHAIGAEILFERNADSGRMQSLMKDLVHARDELIAQLEQMKRNVLERRENP